MDKVKETDDLLLLIEQHKKEIWEWKQKESKWLQDRLASALDINDEHQRYNGKLQLRLTEVEDDNKKLSTQIQDLTASRKFGDGTH